MDTYSELSKRRNMKPHLLEVENNDLKDLLKTDNLTDLIERLLHMESGLSTYQINAIYRRMAPLLLRILKSKTDTSLNKDVLEAIRVAIEEEILFEKKSTIN